MYNFPAEVVEFEMIGGSGPAGEDSEDEAIVAFEMESGWDTHDLSSNLVEFPSARIRDPTQEPEGTGMASAASSGRKKTRRAIQHEHYYQQHKI
jgi:hypothetical protein